MTGGAACGNVTTRIMVVQILNYQLNGVRNEISSDIVLQSSTDSFTSHSITQKNP
jgi:hypothetical protein